MFHVKHSLDDTIAAIATPLGVGGVGVIRISGDKAKPILQAIFHKNNKNKLISHKLTHGWIKDPGKIDEVMACYMKGPATFTGEDVAEIHCHGGLAVVNKIVQAAIRKGARLAERGEFTKRAFLNGKMDLVQAEAVLDLIKATTSESAGYALGQLEGYLSRKIKEIRGQLIQLLAKLEMQIDFGEEAPAFSYPQALNRINKEKARIEELLQSENAGRVYRQGVSVAIAGKPNVGKSSLLNAILEEERAIVTEFPGTTRDTVEEVVEIKGLPVKLIDTAGIRTGRANEKAERLGMERAKRAIADADYIIFMIDGSKTINPEDKAVFYNIKDKKGVFVVNKIDLGIRANQKEIMYGHRKMPLVKASALTGQGVKEIVSKLYEIIYKNEDLEDRGRYAINQRQKGCLDRAKESLGSAGNLVGQRRPIELVTMEIKEAISALGEITGEEVSAEVIKMIFEQFCIGK